MEKIQPYVFAIENIRLHENTQKARRNGFEGELMVQLRNEREARNGCKALLLLAGRLDSISGAGSTGEVPHIHWRC